MAKEDSPSVSLRRELQDAHSQPSLTETIGVDEDADEVRFLFVPPSRTTLGHAFEYVHRPVKAIIGLYSQNDEERLDHLLQLLVHLHLLPSSLVSSTSLISRQKKSDAKKNWPPTFLLRWDGEKGKSSPIASPGPHQGEARVTQFLKANNVRLSFFPFLFAVTFHHDVVHSPNNPDER